MRDQIAAQMLGRLEIGARSPVASINHKYGAAVTPETIRHQGYPQPASFGSFHQ